MGCHTDALSASLGAATGPNTMPGLMVTSSQLQKSKAAHRKQHTASLEPYAALAHAHAHAQQGAIQLRNFPVVNFTLSRKLCAPFALCNLVCQPLTLPLAVGVAVEGYAAVQSPILLCAGTE